ncbi:MAG: hypothetical protein BGO67_00545 [Alphaproteobacteria bacterium 41-28]|jgi:hypothetical protein|nr:MAG: hypothetical protein BGO67_00545 [Alphaproteobacteria bacterium 41-28]
MKNKILYNVSKTVLALAFFHSQFDTAQADIFALEDFNATEYTRHYNSLPAVEDSNKELQVSTFFAPFLKEAESVVVQYELEPYIGLRLIHRHFPVEGNQLMAEEYQTYKEQPSLVTSAYEVDGALLKGMIPASWILAHGDGDEVTVFEASNDAAVHTGSKMIQKNPEFLDEMGKLLEDNNLNNILAVALLKRDALVASENQIYLEINDSEHDKSIVQLWDVSKQNKDAIVTSWSFKGPREQRCIRESVCVPDDSRRSGHVIRQSHRNVK